MSQAVSSAKLAYLITPYCGSAPSPADILGRWNLDPVLLAILVLGLAAYALAGPAHADRRNLLGWRPLCFYGGWLVGTLALVSPLCALSVSLFSARVSEHMVLATVAAPLVALGRPGDRLAEIGRRVSGGRARAPSIASQPRPLLSAAAFTAALWFWHAPVPYTSTFESDAVYWAMQVTLFGSAFWVWSALLDRANDHLAGFVGATFLITGQMGLLGALITFAGRALYPPHQLTTGAWGLTPLEDQQLGGVVMWIPAGAIFTIALVTAFVEVMRRAETRSGASFAAQRG